jgi:nucleoside-diphosphate-sugar epimerase
MSWLATCVSLTHWCGQWRAATRCSTLPACPSSGSVTRASSIWSMSRGPVLSSMRRCAGGLVPLSTPAPSMCSSTARGCGTTSRCWRPKPLLTSYERSKQLADQVVAEAISRGLSARFIHPAAVYGPSLTSTPGLNDIIAKPAANRLLVLPPGGVPVVFATDVARGQIAAAAAAVGSRYILCDRYVSFGELADAVTHVAGSPRPPQLSARLARVVSRLTEAASRATGRPPLLPAGQLHFMTAHHLPDATRAAAELSWVPTPLEEGLAITIGNRDRLSQRPTIQQGA